MLWSADEPPMEGLESDSDWGFMPECSKHWWCVLRAVVVLTAGPILLTLFVLQLVSDRQYARQAKQYADPYYEISSEHRGIPRLPSSRRPLMKLLVHRIFTAASLLFTCGWWLQVPELDLLEVTILSTTCIDLVTALLLIQVLVIAYLVLKALFSSNRVAVPTYSTRIFYAIASLLIVNCLLSNFLSYMHNRMWPRAIWFITVAAGTWVCLGVFFKLAFRLRRIINTSSMVMGGNAEPESAEASRTSDLARSVLNRFLRLMVLTTIVGFFATVFQVASAVSLIRKSRREADLTDRLNNAQDSVFHLVFGICQITGLITGLWWGWVPIRCCFYTRFVPQWCCCYRRPQLSANGYDDDSGGGIVSRHRLASDASSFYMPIRG